MKSKCDCDHASQDKLHGKGIRVFNLCNKGARCTCCAKVVETKKAAEVIKKK